VASPAQQGFSLSRRDDLRALPAEVEALDVQVGKLSEQAIQGGVLTQLVAQGVIMVELPLDPAALAMTQLAIKVLAQAELSKLAVIILSFRLIHNPHLPDFFAFPLDDASQTADQISNLKSQISNLKSQISNLKSQITKSL
jgi:hypothetical protein